MAVLSIIKLNPSQSSLFDNFIHIGIRNKMKLGAIRVRPEFVETIRSTGRRLSSPLSSTAECNAHATDGQNWLLLCLLSTLTCRFAESYPQSGDEFESSRYSKHARTQSLRKCGTFIDKQLLPGTRFALYLSCPQHDGSKVFCEHKAMLEPLAAYSSIAERGDLIGGPTVWENMWNYLKRIELRHEWPI